MPRIYVKIRKRRKQPKVPENALDKVSTNQKRRGRPARVRVNDIVGHAYNNTLISRQVWGSLWPLLKNARTEEEVDRAFLEGAGTYYKRTDIWSPATVLELLRDPDLPKRSEAQIKFFAESLAATGICAPRYARDICGIERAKEKRAHRIIRFEVWIECSCRFKGHSRNHACPKCGTRIQFPWNAPFQF